jgi:hypothetical protein
MDKKIEMIKECLFTKEHEIALSNAENLLFKLLLEQNFSSSIKVIFTEQDEDKFFETFQIYIPRDIKKQLIDTSACVGYRNIENNLIQYLFIKKFVALCFALDLSIQSEDNKLKAWKMKNFATFVIHHEIGHLIFRELLISICKYEEEKETTLINYSVLVWSEYFAERHAYDSCKKFFVDHATRSKDNMAEAFSRIYKIMEMDVKLKNKLVCLYLTFAQYAAYFHFYNSVVDYSALKSTPGMDEESLVLIKQFEEEILFLFKKYENSDLLSVLPSIKTFGKGIFKP